MHYSALIMPFSALSPNQRGTDGDPVAAALGRRLRTARQARAWTLDDLAEASGISRRMIVTIEAGRGNATLNTLLRLASAVEIPLAELVSASAPDANVMITEAGDHVAFWKGEGGGTALLVANARTPDALELWQWHLEPGEEYVSQPHSPGTRELLHVTRGRLDLVVGSDCVTLETGASASFTADVPHAYRVEGRRATDFTMTVLEPIGRSHA